MMIGADLKMHRWGPLVHGFESIWGMSQGDLWKEDSDKARKILRTIYYSSGKMHLFFTWLIKELQEVARLA